MLTILSFFGKVLIVFSSLLTIVDAHVEELGAFSDMNMITICCNSK